MADLTNAWLGYVKEVTYGIRVKAGTPADTVSYVNGDWEGSFPVPMQKPTIIEHRKSGNFDLQTLLIGRKIVEFPLNQHLLDPARELFQVLGKVTTTGPVSSLYTHTIVGQQPSDGATLPSRTYHIQSDGMSTDKIIDIAGTYTPKLQIGWGLDKPGLHQASNHLAQRLTDETATTDLNGVASAGNEDDAEVYTAAPILGTGVTEADVFYLNNFFVAGVDISADIIGGNVKIVNTLQKNFSNRPTKFDNYGLTQNAYLSSAFVVKREYAVTIEVKPTDLTVAVFNKYIKSYVDYDLTFQWKRTTITNSKVHTVDWTFDTSQSPLTDLSAVINPLLTDSNKWILEFQPKTLVDVVCVDENSAL